MSVNTKSSHRIESQGLIRQSKIIEQFCDNIHWTGGFRDTAPSIDRSPAKLRERLMRLLVERDWLRNSTSAALEVPAPERRKKKLGEDSEPNKVVSD